MLATVLGKTGLVEDTGGMDPTASLAFAESQADDLVTDLCHGRIDQDEVVARLAATSRPYFAWAAAWSSLLGALDRHPDDTSARRALAVLRAVEVDVANLGGPGVPATTEHPAFIGAADNRARR